MMGTLFLAFFPCRIWPAPNQAAPACPRQARCARPGRHGLIIEVSVKPNSPCHATFGLQARDRAALPRKDAGPVPAPKTKGRVGCKASS